MLIATIVSAPTIPTLCWIAPEMPQAMYSFGATVLPVWPTWAAYGYQPASTTARVAATSPPRAFARRSQSAKLSGPPSPRPPATSTSAWVMSTAPRSASSWPTSLAARDQSCTCTSTFSTVALPPLASPAA